MDFPTAYELLWKLRAHYPLPAQQADFVSYLLLLAQQQESLATFACTAPTPALMQALDQSERNLRRLRADLTKTGWLMRAADTGDRYQLRLRELAEAQNISLPVAIVSVAPVTLPEPVAAPIPTPVVLTSQLAPPALVLVAEPVAPEEESSELIVTATGIVATTKRVTSEQELDLERFNAWCREEAPTVLKIKNTITAQQLTTLYEKYTPEMLAHILRQIDNKAGAAKTYTDAYKTVTNWCNMQLERKNNVVEIAASKDDKPLPKTLLHLTKLARDRQLVEQATPGLFDTTPAVIPKEYQQSLAQAQQRSDFFNWDLPKGSA
jgi:hypothetical protein